MKHFEWSYVLDIGLYKNVPFVYISLVHVDLKSLVHVGLKSLVHSM